MTLVTLGSEMVSVMGPQGRIMGEGWGQQRMTWGWGCERLGFLLGAIVRRRHELAWPVPPAWGSLAGTTVRSGPLPSLAFRLSCKATHQLQEREVPWFPEWTETWASMQMQPGEVNSLVSPSPQNRAVSGLSERPVYIHKPAD